MTGTTKARNIFFKIGNVIGPVIALGLILIPAMAVAQQSARVEAINLITDRNTPEYLLVEKPRLECDGSDSLRFGLVIGEISSVLSVYMGDVICMNKVPSHSLLVLVFYIRSGSNNVESHPVFQLNSADSMQVLIEAFNKLFEEKGYAIPAPGCPEYENDLQASKYDLIIGDHPTRKGVLVCHMDTVFEGYASFRYLNGNLRLERNMKDGKLSGKQKSYHKNGTLLFEKEYRDGIAEGIHLEYYQSGALFSKGNFVEGRAHGEQLLYHENGQLATRIVFKDGDFQSYEAWNEDGTVLE